MAGIYFGIISKLVDRRIDESLASARKERQFAPQGSAGYPFSSTLCFPSEERSGGVKNNLRRMEEHPRPS
jgi:hypothetical protein